MKTAMTEFLEWLENSSNVKDDILNWELVKENALEKEKEQIISAYISDRIPCSEQDAEDYYFSTYKIKKITINEHNHKQHIIDIMKADEDDGLYKMFDTDSDKKH